MWYLKNKTVAIQCIWQYKVLSTSYKGGCVTHSGWVMHIYVSKVTINGSDNGLVPLRRCQAIILISVGILSIQALGTNLSEILSEIHTFSFREMHFKMSEKWQPFGLCLNELKGKTTKKYSGYHICKYIWIQEKAVGNSYPLYQMHWTTSI